MKLFRTGCLWLSLLFCLLPGCVTTQKGGFEKAKTDEAVAIRVHAAKQYLQKREFEPAKRHLKSALALDARSADVHDALALTFHATGEKELAEKHYKKAVEYGDGASRFRINYANFLFHQQQYAAAEVQLEYIVDDSLYEKRESALILLGLTQLQMLDTENAQRSFERALVLNPNNRRVVRELAILTFERGAFEQSWQYFQQYRRVTRQPSAEMLLLGIQLADELGKADERENYLLALRNLYPDSREYKSYLREQAHKKSAN